MRSIIIIIISLAISHTAQARPNELVLTEGSIKLLAGQLTARLPAGMAVDKVNSSREVTHAEITYGRGRFSMTAREIYVRRGKDFELGIRKEVGRQPLMKGATISRIGSEAPLIAYRVVPNSRQTNGHQILSAFYVSGDDPNDTVQLIVFSVSPLKDRSFQWNAVADEIVGALKIGKRRLIGAEQKHQLGLRPDSFILQVPRDVLVVPDFTQRIRYRLQGLPELGADNYWCDVVLGGDAAPQGFNSKPLRSVTGALAGKSVEWAYSQLGGSYHLIASAPGLIRIGVSVYCESQNLANLEALRGLLEAAAEGHLPDGP